MKTLIKITMTGACAAFLLEHLLYAAAAREEQTLGIPRYCVNQIEITQDTGRDEGGISRKEVLRVNTETGQGYILKAQRSGSQWQYYWVEVSENNNASKQRSQTAPLQL